MAGLNHQVCGILDLSSAARCPDRALLSKHSNQNEKPDLDQESHAHDRDCKEHVARRERVHECLASCEAPGVNHFRLENVSVPNADGARCERRRHSRRPKAKSAPGQKRRFDIRPITSDLPQTPDIRCTAPTDVMCHNRRRTAGRMIRVPQVSGTKSYSPTPCSTRNTADVSPALVTRCGRFGGTEKVWPRDRRTSSFGCWRKTRIVPSRT